MNVTSETQIVRPVQFLGSKLRVLAEVTEAVMNGQQRGAGAWDAFTGSTVVAQSLAGNGMQVLATDKLLSSVNYARALLGVGRTDHEDTGVALSAIIALASSSEAEALYDPWLEREYEAVANQDGVALLRVSGEIPQRWQSTDSIQDSRLKTLFAAVTAAGNSSATVPSGLLSSAYSGTYFGLHQAIRLESLRRAIEEWSQSTTESAWIRDVAITALCSAASKAVYSAGKHFAQPHRIRADKDLRFHARRIIDDRSVNVDQEFEMAYNSLVDAARKGSEGHNAQVREAQTVNANVLREFNVRTVYADPPYTAQQYSRFYHLLETITAGIPERLQTIDGRVTRGLYPEDRYKSPFCSRRQAPAAFKDLIVNAKDAGARIVISYSTSAADSTGNRRSIGLNELMELVKYAYGPSRASVTDLEVRYRQFNNSATSVPTRNDPEIMIVGDVDAE